MPLTSDLTLNHSKFSAKSISKETQAFNDQLIEIMKGGPKWYEVGAAKYRLMRENGETPLPKPVHLDRAKDIHIPSREKGREIPCRVMTPEGSNSASPHGDKSPAPRGVFYHIHGGGWVLQNEGAQDIYLRFLADEHNLTVVSVGYRLSPEDPYPRANEDCFDVGEFLIDNAEREFGAPLLFLGGESAGGHLSACTVFHLLESRPEFQFRGLVLNYGAYDVSGFLPQAWHFDLPLVLDVDIMIKYMEAYCPGMTQEQKRNPKISPLYQNMSKFKLPPALFNCGTLDPLLDDSVLMSTKWMMSGAEAILKIYPGAPHGFTLFPPTAGTETVKDSFSDITTFLSER